MAGPVPAPGGSVEPPPVPTAGVAGVGVGVRTPNVSEQELDQTILNAAITNGALELLPETLSTMAIIPLQMRLVYRIGQAYGYELDSGHVKDFLATVGVGLTSQYLEQAGRKLLGGLLGAMALMDRSAGFALIVAFVWMPVAVVYAAVSTIVLLLLRPGRAAVAVAHAVALGLAVLAPLLFLKAGSGR